MDSVKYIEMKKIALFILLIGFSNLQAQKGIGTEPHTIIVYEALGMQQMFICICILLSSQQLHANFL